MTVRELTRSFLEISCKPKKTYMVAIFLKGSRIDDPKQIQHNDYIGDERHYRPGLLDAKVFKWWIERDTIMILIEKE